MFLGNIQKKSKISCGLTNYKATIIFFFHICFIFVQLYSKKNLVRDTCFGNCLWANYLTFSRIDSHSRKNLLGNSIADTWDNFNIRRLRPKKNEFCVPYKTEENSMNEHVFVAPWFYRGKKIKIKQKIRGEVCSWHSQEDNRLLPFFANVSNANYDIIFFLAAKCKWHTRGQWLNLNDIWLLLNYALMKVKLFFSKLIQLVNLF